MMNSKSSAAALGKSRSVNEPVHVAKIPFKESDNAKTVPINPARQKKLEEIRDREMIKGKMDQLQKVLAKKMVFKYGRVNIDVINQAIDEFVHHTDKITPDSLTQLENSIQKNISVATLMNTKNGNNENGRNTPQNHETSKPSSANQPSRQQGSHGNNNNNTATASSLAPVLQQVKGAEWQIIATYDKIVGDEIEQRAKEKERQSRMQFKKSLDDHITIAKELHHATDGKEDLQYSQHVNADVERFHREEEIKREKLKQKNLELLRLRQEQIDEQINRKNNEKIKSRQFEHGILATAQEKLAIEREIVLDAKRRDRELRSQIEQDNIENKRVAALVKGKERSEDQKLMAEYAAKLDREAYERDNAFKKRMEHIDKSALQFALEGAGKVAAEEEKRREALQMKELEKAIERERQEFIRKEHDKKLRIQRMLKDNNILTEAREDVKRQEMQSKIIVSKQYKQDEDALYRDLNEQKQLRALRQHEYNELLNQQLLDRERYRIRVEEMVDQEKAINQEKLTKALTRNEIVTQVFSKTKVLPPRSMAPI